MKTFFISLLCLFMFGCVSTEEKQARIASAKAQQDRADAITDSMIAAAKTPLIEFTCPPQGCVFTSMKIANPQGILALADAAKEVNKPVPHQMSEGGQIALALIGAVKDVGAGAVIAKGVSNVVNGFVETSRSGNAANVAIATEGFSVNGKIATQIPQPIAINVSGSPGAAVATGGSASGSQQTTTTTTTSTSKVINGSGVIDGGTLTAPVCTINPTTGVKTCS